MNNGKDNYDYMLKILIVGDSAVGKSALLLKFSEDQFISSHIATIGVDFKYKNILCDGKRYRLQVWDTAGQEKFRAIVQTYYKGAMGILLVYSVDDRQSFENVENWIKQITKSTETDTVIILVGNKTDIENREITTQEGEELARRHNVTFFETSAKTGHNVQEAFFSMTKEIHAKVGENPIVNNSKKALQPENLRANSSDNVTLAADEHTKTKASSGKKCQC